MTNTKRWVDVDKFVDGFTICGQRQMGGSFQTMIFNAHFEINYHKLVPFGGGSAPYLVLTV
jgi:hypothetical protein